MNISKMDYKAVVFGGWRKDTLYYSSEEQARHVCEWALNDGGWYELYKRTENGWELIETKGERNAFYR